MESSWVHPFTAGWKDSEEGAGFELQQPESEAGPCLESKHQNAYSKSKVWICWALSRDAIDIEGLLPAGCLCSAKPNDADRSHKLALMGSCFIYSGADLTFPSPDESMDLQITRVLSLYM